MNAPTSSFPNPNPVTPPRPLLVHVLYVVLLLLAFAAVSQLGAATVLWSNTGASTAWYTNTNWTANTSSAQWTTSDIAQFADLGTATTSGINIGTSALSIGAIEVTSARTRALTIGNSSGTAGNLTLNGTTVSAVNNVVLHNASANNLTIQDNETGTGKTMNVVLGNTTNNIVLIDGAGNINISSAISGSSKKLSLQGTGAGDLVLSGTNTFTGGIDISGSGKLRLGAAAALPTTGNIAVSGDGRIRFAVAGTYGSTSQNATFSPTGTTNPAIDLQTSNIAVTFNPNVALNADTRIESNGATGSLTLAGNLTGSGTLVKQAAGNLILSGTGNTATGGTQIGNGTITVNSGSKLGTGNLTLAQTSTNATTVALNNATQSIGNLSSSWTATTGTIAQTLTLTGTALTINQTVDGTFGPGAVSTLTSVIGGTGSLIKLGAATLSLGNSYTYTGTTTVSAGTLSIVSQTLASTNPISIATGAALTSNGTLKFNGNGTSTYSAITGTGTGVINLRSTTSSATTPDISFNDNDVANATTNYGTRITAAIDLGSSQRFIWGKTNHNSVSNYLASTGVDAEFKGAISGSGGLTFVAQASYTASGAMEVPFVLSGANTFTGMVEIQRGSVYLNNAAALTQGNVLNFTPTTGNNARLFLIGNGATISNLQSSGAGSALIANGNVTNASAIAAATLTVNQTSDTTYSGTLVDSQAEYDRTTGSSSGALALLKTGSSTLTLSSGSTYSGGTIISAGQITAGNATALGTNTKSS